MEEALGSSFGLGLQNGIIDQVRFSPGEASGSIPPLLNDVCQLMNDQPPARRRIGIEPGAIEAHPISARESPRAQPAHPGGFVKLNGREIGLEEVLDVVQE